MVMPLAGRVVAAVAGGLLVLVAVSSVTVTLIVSRPVSSRLTWWVDRMVDWASACLAAVCHSGAYSALSGIRRAFSG